MNSTDITGYTYRADTYCRDCILEVLISYREASPAVRDFTEPLQDTLDYLGDCQGIDTTDERSYDSSEWPKVIFGNDPSTCGRCGEEF